jgi:ATP-binding cassette subfamily D (ALD) long-chain fatty acid import protein
LRCASGKSSLLRVLAGLWPFEEGTVTRPLTIGPGGLFFLPQRPYLTAGTLRAQLLYPDTDAGAQRANDAELVQVSRTVPLLGSC